MAKDKTTKKRRFHIELSATKRWAIGLVLLFVAMYVTYAAIAFLFTWKDNQSFVQYGDFMPTGQTVIGGSLSAKIGDVLIAKSFGVFGLVIPIVLIILAIRIMRFRRTFLERAARLSLTAMIIGSVTLGLLFGTRWSIFGTGLGGTLGIYASEWLVKLLGTIGTGLLMLCMWVLWAVAVNRKAINAVNEVGSAIADGGKRIKDLVQHDSATDVGTDTPTDDEPTADEQGEEPVETPENPFKDIEQEDFEIAHPASEPLASTTVGQADTPPKADDDFEVTALGDEPTLDTAEDTVANDLKSDGSTVLSTGGIVVTDADGMEIVAESNKDPEAENPDEIDLYDPLKELSSYHRPEIEGLLNNYDSEVQVTADELRENKDQIVRTLKNFGIQIEKIKATIGPTVTLYEIVPAAGVKISKIKGLEQDIALSLKALGIRIIAPMPGKGTIGIEVPNKDRKTVSMYSVIKSIRFQDSHAELPIALGKTIQNETFVIDLAKLPHLLVAGATGQGKSVGLNAIIASLLYKKHPAELKFVMVDPKKVELSMYSKLDRHFLAKMESEDDAILTDTQRVVYTLNSLCNEMEARYELLRSAEVKKISEYNEKFIARRLNPKKGHRYLPYIVVVIDEFADMIMTAGKEIEQPITRLAQLARAVGIHMIIATQRPDVKVITGLIKANFPARIAFKVTSIVDSRTILDQTGAQHLIGMGDMLVSINSEITRVQCAFIDTPEIEGIVNFISRQAGYSSPYLLPDYVPEGSEGSASSGGEDSGALDSMFADAARFVVGNQSGSTSSIQRRFSIGYNRAGRIMDQLENRGIVGRAEGSKPREVLITDLRSLDRILEDLGINQ